MPILNRSAVGIETKLGSNLTLSALSVLYEVERSKSKAERNNKNARYFGGVFIVAPSKRIEGRAM